jgi:hypothetical protein
MRRKQRVYKRRKFAVDALGGNGLIQHSLRTRVSPQRSKHAQLGMGVRFNAEMRFKCGSRGGGGTHRDGREPLVASRVDPHAT